MSDSLWSNKFQRFSSRIGPWLKDGSCYGVVTKLVITDRLRLSACVRRCKPILRRRRPRFLRAMFSKTAARSTVGPSCVQWCLDGWSSFVNATSLVGIKGSGRWHPMRQVHRPSECIFAKFDNRPQTYWVENDCHSTPRLPSASNHFADKVDPVFLRLMFSLSLAQIVMSRNWSSYERYRPKIWSSLVEIRRSISTQNNAITQVERQSTHHNASWSHFIGNC